MLSKNQEHFVQEMIHELESYSASTSGKKMNKSGYEKKAKGLGITEQTEIKELVELALYLRAKNALKEFTPGEDAFEALVDDYNAQPNISHRSSQSIIYQQYSTPLPIAYAMGYWCGLHQGTRKKIVEPSAGNALLLIANQGNTIYANEIDTQRYQNLQYIQSEDSSFKKITQLDASDYLHKKDKTYLPKSADVIITNPPFDNVHPISIDGYKFSALDHVMVERALALLKDDGKAAIIIGGHTSYDKLGRIQTGKNRIFMSWLYKHYNVVDTINVDGKLYARQGTRFDIRILLIDGRNTDAASIIHPPLLHTLPTERQKTVDSFYELWDRLYEGSNKSTHLQEKSKMKNIRLAKLKEQARLRLLGLNKDNRTLDGPYPAITDGCYDLEVDVPDSMDYEILAALANLKHNITSPTEYLTEKLHYKTPGQLCKALASEQADAVALGIYNIESRGQGLIIGDQTGIGKGRQAASIIRYAKENGITPIFLTEKVNLFTDIYRDLVDIGCSHYKPFIVNARNTSTDIQDKGGNVVYRALAPAAQKTQLENAESDSLKDSFDFIVATYSQFNKNNLDANLGEIKLDTKGNFLLKISKGAILILDESHNASGNSKTGSFLRTVLQQAKGVIFLSATFAKRPDNMTIYSNNTVLSETNLKPEEMQQAFERGGVAIQELVASQLVKEGQMIRRQRSFEGIEVNYIHLHKNREEHVAISNNITEIIREIIQFEEDYINSELTTINKEIAASMSEAEKRKGTVKGGVANTPTFSKIFNLINQLLFSIKVNDVADHTIARLKEGKKPVVAFSSTMGAFVDENDPETVLKADFTAVINRALHNTLKYTVKDAEGNTTPAYFDITEFGEEAQAAYFAIEQKIRSYSSGITISPIDVLIERITEAGFTVAEVTGRKKYLNYTDKNRSSAIVMKRTKENVASAFRKFNNNEVDVLLINQSGSTGASAHAIVTDTVTASEVKQRVMIVLQAELDINREVQKRGRINRTGQIKLPIYDYLISPIPAEKRLMMMLQAKLKSLDANTTSNSKNSQDNFKFDDFLNKYGDDVVAQYLLENEEFNKQIGNPLKIGDQQLQDGKVTEKQDAAKKVSGRVAILPVRQQEEFYDNVLDGYEKYVRLLIQQDRFDLIMDELPLEATTLEKTLKIAGSAKGNSIFSGHAYIEKCEVNNLRKPNTLEQLNNLLKNSLDGNEAGLIQSKLVSRYQNHVETKVELEKTLNEEKRQVALEAISKESAYKKLKTESEREQYYQERNKALNDAFDERIGIIVTKLENQQSSINRIFNFFTIGQSVMYPIPRQGDAYSMSKGIFIGFVINEKKSNPFAPSAITASFALADSNKRIDLTLSGESYRQLQEVMSNSYGMGTKDFLAEWEEIVKEKNNDRVVRYIITGNVLLALGSTDAQGKLISYTTSDNSIKKGVLLPDGYHPGVNNEGASGNQPTVSIPIQYALPIVKGLTNYQMLTTDSVLSIGNKFGDYVITVPASRIKGGKFYTHKKLLSIVGVFNKAGLNMSATIPEGKEQQVLDLLNNEFKIKAILTHSQFELIKDQLPQQKVTDESEERKRVEDLKHHLAQRQKNTIKPEPIAQESSPTDKRLRLAKAKAKARLRLLALSKETNQLVTT